MWVGQDFDDLDAGAVDTFTFKFDRLLADGEALSVPQTQWTATVLEVAPGCSRDDNPARRRSVSVRRMGGRRQSAT